MKILQETSARWFLGPRAAPEAETILFCLPNAGGGGTSYSSWGRFLPARVWAQPVQLPGRENRVYEPAAFDPGDLASALLDYVDRPYALYGHSMGGVLAFEVAIELERRGATPPARLYVGASVPPHLDRRWVERWAALPDDELLREVVRLGGTPEAVLRHGRLRERLIRVLRSDMGWLAAYRMDFATKPAVPIVGFAGDADPLSGPEVMRQWEHVSPEPFRLHVLHGGHLFHVEDPAPLTSLIATDLCGSG